VSDTALEVVLWVALAVGAVVVVAFLLGRGD
jgi:hypothetical protein